MTSTTGNQSTRSRRAIWPLLFTPILTHVQKRKSFHLEGGRRRLSHLTVGTQMQVGFAACRCLLLRLLPQQQQQLAALSLMLSALRLHEGLQLWMQ